MDNNQTTFFYNMPFNGKQSNTNSMLRLFKKFFDNNNQNKASVESNWNIWWNRNPKPSPLMFKASESRLVKQLVEPEIKKRGITDYSINSYTMKDGLHSWAFKNNSRDNKSVQSKLIKTPLVLIHGYLTSSMHYHKNVADLMTKYKEVYLIDLPGHGATDFYQKVIIPKYEPTHKIEYKFERKYEQRENGEVSKEKELFFYSKRQLDSFNYKRMFYEIRKDFFNDSIERWMRTQNMRKINLVGHSYGGYFSFHLWKDRPDLVNKLVMLSPLGVEKNIWSINNLILKDEKYKVERDPTAWTYLPTRKISEFFLNNQYKIFMGLGPIGVRLLQNFFKFRFKNESEMFQKYSFENAYLQSDANLELNTILFNSFFSNYLTSYDPILDYGEVIDKRKDDIKIMYGDHDWMDKRCASEFKHSCIIPNSGHNLNIDNPKDTLNEITNFLTK